MATTDQPSLDSILSEVEGYIATFVKAAKDLHHLKTSGEASVDSADDVDAKIDAQAQAAFTTFKQNVTAGQTGAGIDSADSGDSVAPWGPRPGAPKGPDWGKVPLALGVSTSVFGFLAGMFVL
jgi:hypothetical protein